MEESARHVHVRRVGHPQLARRRGRDVVGGERQTAALLLDGSDVQGRALNEQVLLGCLRALAFLVGYHPRRVDARRPGFGEHTRIRRRPRVAPGPHSGTPVSESPQGRDGDDDKDRQRPGDEKRILPQLLGNGARRRGRGSLVRFVTGCGCRACGPRGRGCRAFVGGGRRSARGEPLGSFLGEPRPTLTSALAPSLPPPLGARGSPLGIVVAHESCT